MYNRNYSLSILFIFLQFTLINGFGSGKTELNLVSWDKHLGMNNLSVANDWARHVWATDSSKVRVAQFIYSDEEQILNAFYPPGADSQSSYPILILMGNPDNTVKQEYGVPYYQTPMALGWGQVMANEGFIVIAFQSDRTPEKDVIKVVQWIREKGDSIGMDARRIGLLSSSNSCISALKATRPEKTGIPYPSLRFSVLAYGSLMKLSGMDTNVAYCVVTAEKDTTWTDQSTVKAFLEKMSETEANVINIHHSTGGHGFDMQVNNSETDRVIQEMIDFMKLHAGI